MTWVARQEMFQHLCGSYRNCAKLLVSLSTSLLQCASASSELTGRSPPGFTPTFSPHPGGPVLDDYFNYIDRCPVHAVTATKSAPPVAQPPVAFARRQ